MSNVINIGNWLDNVGAGIKELVEVGMAAQPPVGDAQAAAAWSKMLDVAEEYYPAVSILPREKLVETLLRGWRQGWQLRAVWTRLGFTAARGEAVAVWLDSVLPVPETGEDDLTVLQDHRILEQIQILDPQMTEAGISACLRLAGRTVGFVLARQKAELERALARLRSVEVQVSN
jgi:hypothetical protein